MSESDFIAITVVGVALALWLASGLICAGRAKTYRLGLWVLGSGAITGLIAGLCWDWIV